MYIGNLQNKLVEQTVAAARQLRQPRLNGIVEVRNYFVFAFCCAIVKWLLAYTQTHTCYMYIYKLISE